MNLVIKNVGPINEVDIDFNKINVLIGPQSSGKSTINKIFCFLSWVEKKVSLDQSFDFFYEEDSFQNNLEMFHNMKGYIRDDSVIKYKSDILEIDYSPLSGRNVPFFKWINRYDFIRPTVSYIPAERNLVSIIQNLSDVKLPENNIMYYLRDWVESRESHNEESPLLINSLNVSYQFDSKKICDYIFINEQDKLELSYTSSGIQSLVPLYVLLDFFMNNLDHPINKMSIYEKKRMKALEEQLKLYSTDCFKSEIDKNVDRLKSIAIKLIEKSFQVEVDQNIIANMSGMKMEELYRFYQVISDAKPEYIDKTLISETKELLQKVDDKFESLRMNYTRNNYIKLFLEEPETNAFPDMQKEVIYDLMHYMKSNIDNKLMITTHSPYILYALNNCMLGGQIKSKLSTNDKERISSIRGWIDPKEVSVWQVKEGRLEDIKHEQLQIIGPQYFSEILGETMSEYNYMLKICMKNER